ncbi:uncharacterized protein V1513DRAFT_63011 [Lipomyces chichibuensis]|uniref:uncharacterized protein n=1 Tax=Lipomyces chichibuensis TaxID=1546026 RepID=UPI003343FB74
MRPSGPVVANTATVIDLTDSSDTSPASSHSTAPAQRCGAYLGNLTWPHAVAGAPVPHQSDVQSNSIPSLTESTNRRHQSGVPLVTPQEEVIDVDELSDVGIQAADPAFRFNGDLRTLQQANRDTTDSNADNEDDVAVTFTRRRVDPMPRNRRLDRTPVPPAEDGSFFRHVSNHNRPRNGHSARSPSAVGVLDLDTITSRPDFTQQNRRQHRTTVGVGGGIGDYMTRRAAVVTTRRSPRGRTARMLLPIYPPSGNDITPHIYGYFPHGRPRSSADVEQLDRLQDGFLDEAPRAFVRPHLDYGTFDDDHEWSFENFDDDFLAEAAEMAAGMAAAEAIALRRRTEEARVSVTKPTVPPPRKGYTRMISSGTKLVCPDCDHILGAPSQSAEEEKGLRPNPKPRDIHRTIWAGKCGHVYCGKCAAKYRKARRGRKDCVGLCLAPGCKQNLTGARGMFEIFA